jgi:hypothetical protein
MVWKGTFLLLIFVENAKKVKSKLTLKSSLIQVRPGPDYSRLKEIR